MKKNSHLHNLAVKLYLSYLKYKKTACFLLLDKRIKTMGITKVKRATPIVVTLTSYPARIPALHHTVSTLLNQKLKPDYIVLWLADSQFPNKEKDLPESLLELIPFGLTIRWTKDIRSYKKLIPAIKEFPNSILVTADDDIMYSRSWLSDLYHSYLDNNKQILIYANLCFKIKLVNGIVQPQSTWTDDCKKEEKLYSVYSTTGGGNLYPPGVFPIEVFAENQFSKLCPYEDDLWFWAMAVINGVKTMHIYDKNRYVVPNVKSDNEYALWATINSKDNENYNQLRCLIDTFPLIMERLTSEE